MVINIDVKNKIATPDGSVIVCGNSDYQIKFTFDSEWDGLQFKTARFVYRKAGEVRFIDVSFAGDTVDVPTLAEIRCVYVGVYTDALRTTSPAEIACEYSIRCNSGENVEEFTQEDRDQLIALFNMAAQAAETAQAAAETATDAKNEAKASAVLAEEAIGSVVSKVKEHNGGRYLTFWIGTQAEYDLLPSKETNCMYIITDDNTSRWTESTEYTGCFSRPVTGDDLGLTEEWLNPPIKFRKENTLEIFRTAERRNEAPVYCYALYGSFLNPSGIQSLEPSDHIGFGGTFCEYLDSALSIDGSTSVFPYIIGNTIYAASPFVLKDSNNDVFSVKVNFPNQLIGTVDVQIIVKFTTY